MSNFIYFETYESVNTKEQLQIKNGTTIFNVSLISKCSEYIMNKDFSVITILDGDGSTTALVKISIEELCKKLEAVKIGE